MFERSAKKNFVSDPCMRADRKILSAAVEKQSRKYVDIYLFYPHQKSSGIHRLAHTAMQQFLVHKW